jgi:hypothetical protein
MALTEGVQKITRRPTAAPPSGAPVLVPQPRIRRGQGIILLNPQPPGPGTAEILHRSFQARRPGGPVRPPHHQVLRRPMNRPGAHSHGGPAPDRPLQYRRKECGRKELPKAPIAARHKDAAADAG